MKKLFLFSIATTVLMSCEEPSGIGPNGSGSVGGGDDNQEVVVGDPIVYSPSFKSIKYRPIEINWKASPTSSVKTSKARVLQYVEGLEVDTTVATYLARTNKWGSDISQTSHEATGRFYVKKINDRFWIIDPEGYISYQRGVCAVTPGESSRNKQEWLRKYGSVNGWYTGMKKEFGYMGFHATGAFGKEHYQTLMDHNDANPTKPLTLSPSMAFLTAFKNDKRYADPGGLSANRLGVLFNGGWDAWCEEYCEEVLEPYKNREDVFGFFSDNELDFSSMNSRILQRFLDVSDTNNEAYKAAKKFMTDKGATTVNNQLNSEFAGIIAEMYYGGIAKAANKYDPELLYLGSRLHGTPKNLQGVMEAAGRHCDVISINYYSAWSPELVTSMDKWSQWAPETPIIITEFYTKGADVLFPSAPGASLNGHGAGFIVDNQLNRAQCYQHFTLGLLESKQCVGWHWFRYIDDDPEMSNKGLYKYNFEPYEQLEQYSKALNYTVYDIIEFFDAK